MDSKAHSWPQFGLVNLFGHWPGAGLRGRLQRGLSYTVVLGTVLLLAAEVVSTRRAFRDGHLQAGLVNLNELLSAGQCCVFVLTFLLCRGPIAAVVSALNGLTGRVLEQDCQDPAVRAEVSRRRRRCLWAHRIFFWSFVLICHWALRPVLQLLLYGQLSFIVHSWLPFDNTHLSGFFGNYFFQLIPCVSFCLSFCMFGSVFVSFCEIILGHMKILQHRLKSIKYGTSETNIMIRNCVEHHQDLLKVIQTFQHFTSIPLIAFCLLTVLVLCVILFELTVVESTTTERVINVLEEAQQEFLFLATYCWYGNEITFQCSELLKPGYFTDWYNGSRGEKKTLHILMTRTMVAGYFGGFIRIDLLTFINVLKAAFSYYNFLEAMNDN